MDILEDKTTKGKVLMAMSGGVDSSIAASMLLEQGYELVGMTMKVWNADPEFSSAAAIAAQTEAINEASALATRLGFPHYTVDFTDKFEDIVIKNFINEYISGRTPNPCVVCNVNIKWKELLAQADKLGCKYIGTGHYAKIKQQNGRYFIQSGIDPTKDQSYFLWGLPQDFLSRTLFPLGEFEKTVIKEHASQKGFVSLAEKKESYDICFLPDKDYRQFLMERIPDKIKKLERGNFVLTNGKVVGQHKGFPFYTIGQRKGLEIALGTPHYVVEIDAKTNTIVLGCTEDLQQNELWVRDFSISKYENIPEEGLHVNTKIRYRQNGVPSLITKHDDKIKVCFEEPVTGVTPGQSAVFMQGDDLVGGGFIL